MGGGMSNATSRSVGRISSARGEKSLNRAIDKAWKGAKSESARRQINRAARQRGKALGLHVS